MLLLILSPGLSAGERFDTVVRNDFFARFAGGAVAGGNPSEPYQKGLSAMAAALTPASGQVSVINPRGATLLEAGAGSDEEGAHGWFQKPAAAAESANGHLWRAKAFLESNKLTGPVTCIGCHMSK